MSRTAIEILAYGLFRQLMKQFVLPEHLAGVLTADEENELIFAQWAEMPESEKKSWTLKAEAKNQSLLASSVSAGAFEETKAFATCSRSIFILASSSKKLRDQARCSVCTKRLILVSGFRAISNEATNFPCAAVTSISRQPSGTASPESSGGVSMPTGFEPVFAPSSPLTPIDRVVVKRARGRPRNPDKTPKSPPSLPLPPLSPPVDTSEAFLTHSRSARDKHQADLFEKMRLSYVDRDFSARPRTPAQHTPTSSNEHVSPTVALGDIIEGGPCIEAVSLWPPSHRAASGSGTLSTHKNGFSFTADASGGLHVNILRDNISCAFFQAADGNNQGGEHSSRVNLIHFVLNTAIQVGNKETTHLQVRATPNDDGEDRRRQNRIFADFVTKVGGIFHGLEISIPYRELAFSGLLRKSKISLQPVVYHLVSLQSSPFFVLPLAQVEICHFERVSPSLRTFDLVFVLKSYADHSMPIHDAFISITSISKDSLSYIKDWLDAADLNFFEGAVNLNWYALLSHVRRDLSGFWAEGGWKVLAQGSSDDDADSIDDLDEDYDGQE